MTINTKSIPTWCAGCTNFAILAGFKKFLTEEIEKGKKKEDFAMVAGIGCHARIFDYVNIGGLHTLHGRVLPTCLGLKVGNPNLTVFGFSGDGDAYLEGMEHLIHAARYNSNINYIVHNNQVLALTIGQPTPTTEIGFKDKSHPQGVKIAPINPIKIMLASGASFVARIYSDLKQIEYVLKEAIKHKGFSFIEIMQPCISLHPMPGLREVSYSLEEAGHDKTNFNEAWTRADEFDYNEVKKVPMGIFYQVNKPVFEEQIPQLVKLKAEKKSFKDIKR